MSADRRLGVLLLGCGWAARIHSRVLRKIGDVDLIYASRDAGRATSMAAQYRGRAVASYEAGLGDPEVDVALVATPTVTHRKLSEMALAAGKHVIVEKPAFMRSTEADAIRDAATRANRRVFVAENYYYKPISGLLREVIRDGDLGEVRFVTINATKRQVVHDWRSNPEVSGGGALFEGGVHWVSFAANLGLEVESAAGYRTGGVAGADRSSLVVLRYRSGAVATLAHSWELPAPFGGMRSSKVQGTRGSVTFESNGFIAYVSGPRRQMRVFALSDPLGYRAMHEDFIDSIRSGRPSRFTLAMGQRDLVLLEQATAGF